MFIAFETSLKRAFLLLSALVSWTLCIHTLLGKSIVLLLAACEALCFVTVTATYAVPSVDIKRFILFAVIALL